MEADHGQTTFEEVKRLVGLSLVKLSARTFEKARAKGSFGNKGEQSEARAERNILEANIRGAKNWCLLTMSLEEDLPRTRSPEKVFRQKVFREALQGSSSLMETVNQRRSSRQCMEVRLRGGVAIALAPSMHVS